MRRLSFCICLGISAAIGLGSFNANATRPNPIHKSSVENSACPNGAIEDAEQCDDNNVVNGDGCPSNCRLIQCGDGAKEPAEDCDDGSVASLDGCGGEFCEVTLGWTCGPSIIGNPSSTSVCAEICGDALIVGSEQCDGGNLNGQTCATQGFTGGTLNCSFSCQFNTSACFNNVAPVAVDDAGTTAEDVQLIVVRAVLIANDTDANNDTLSLTAVSNANNGSVNLSGTDVVFMPAANFNGTAGFDYTVFDGNLTDVGHVTLTVTPVNDEPGFDPISNQTVNEDASITSLNITNVNTGPINEASQVFELFSATSNNTSLVPNPTISGSGATRSLSFTPNANQSGVATIVVTAQDDGGTANGGDNQFSRTFAISVIAVNDTPIAVDDTGTTAEDTPLSIGAASLLANDTDVDGPILSLTAVSNPINGTVDFAAGNVTFTPAANFSGTASFEYTVSDGTLTDNGLVTVTVTAVNDAPVAVDDAGTTAEDTPLSIGAASLLANDTDVDGPTLSLTAVSNAINGSVVLGAGIVQFTPATNFNGAASFEYTVSDGLLNDTGLVSITVDAVNDAPVANNNSITVNENTIGNLITLTASDVDVPSQTLSFAIATNPANGSLGAITPINATSASVNYTPNTNFSGSDSFTFTTNDGALTSAAATLSITVNNVAVCGDGLIESPETCDDNNTTNGDGCSAVCSVETGFSCSNQPSTCNPICGDSLVVGGEQCDDGPGPDTDGCTSQCKSGRVCTSTAIPGGAAYSTDPATAHCYVNFTGTTTWADAQTDCVGKDGYLMTVTGSGEQNRLHNDLHLGTPWIGGTDAVVEGTFDWVTTEAFSFTAFAAGEPDDDVSLGGNGDCLVAQGGLAEWGDTNCSFVGFASSRVCELPPSTCGDGIVHSGNQCDDGNLINGDGCSSICLTETPLFTEYVEGSGNNKALEIRNPTGAAVTCSVGMYVNGSTTRVNVTNITIPANDLFVVCNSAGTVTGTLGASICDLSVTGAATVVNYNGDDAIDLICGGVTRDVIGQIGIDPGTEWGSAPNSTLNSTLRRNCPANIGDPNGGDAFVPSVNWVGAPVDTVNNLGSFSCP